MNLLEHYILEVLDEKQYYPDDDTFLIVIVKNNCYGIVETTEHFTSKDQWEKDKKNGYFMA